jgi:hypothetical protein
MLPYAMLRLAAKMWRQGKDTALIATFLGLKEHEVANDIERVREYARLMPPEDAKATP